MDTKKLKTIAEENFAGLSRRHFLAFVGSTASTLLHSGTAVSATTSYEVLDGDDPLVIKKLASILLSTVNTNLVSVDKISIVENIDRLDEPENDL